jgi:hypothetical protein
LSNRESFMSSESETEVISCPACKHPLRVPQDWLGQQVQCPECKAKFKAPIRAAEGGLTAPELLEPPTTTTQARKKADPMLLLPAFGLLFCGVAGTIVNAVIAYDVFDPHAGMRWAKNQIPALRQVGLWSDDPPNDRDKLDEQRAEDMVRTFRWVLPVAGLVSAVVFLGGLSIVLRWNRRLAQSACVLAALNVPHLCCVPGSVTGLLGLLMLASDEGRAHFAK